MCVWGCIFPREPLFYPIAFFTYNSPNPVICLQPRKQTQNGVLNTLIRLANLSALVQPIRVGLKVNNKYYYTTELKPLPVR